MNQTMTVQTQIEKLRERENVSPNLRNTWNSLMSESFDVVGDEKSYIEYADDPIGFCEDVLELYLTDDQKLMLLAILKYEMVIVKSATAVGKTFTLAAAAVWLYKTRQEIELYAAAAPPEKNLKRLFWGELERLMLQKPELFENDKSSNLMLRRVPKQHIEGLTIPQSAKPEEVEAKFSGKHQENLVFIFDEADAIPDPVFKGADGCMSGGWARMVMCLNPRRKEGYPYRAIIEDSAHVITMSAFNHPNVITGRDVVRGAVTRNVTVRRIHDWSEPLPYGEEPNRDCFQVPDFLVGFRAVARNGRKFQPLSSGWRIVTDDQMFYKVLGEYPTSAANSLFNEDKINQARSRYDVYVAKYGENPPKDVSVIMSLDVADDGDDYNVVTLRWGSFFTQIRWNGVDPDMTATKAIPIYKENNVKICRIDAIGVGAGVPGKMSRNGCEGATAIKFSEAAKGHSEHGYFKTIRDEAFWLVRLWLHTDESAMLPPGKISDQMRMIKYEHIGKYIKIMDKKKIRQQLGYSPDELDSLVLGFAANTIWMGSI